MAQLKPTSPIGPELSDSFNTDWEQANAQYQDALNKGYSDEDAQKLFLEPTIQKWNIIKTSPSLLQRKDKLTAFTQDFEQSKKNFQDYYNAYSRDGGQSAFSRTLGPTLQKWGVEASLPVKPLVSPEDEAKSLLRVKNGESPFDVVMENPNLLSSPESRVTWNQLLRSGIRQSQKPGAPNPIAAEDYKAAQGNYLKARQAALLAPDDQDARAAAADAGLQLMNAKKKLQPTMPSTSGTGTASAQSGLPDFGTPAPEPPSPVNYGAPSLTPTLQPNPGTVASPMGTSSYGPQPGVTPQIFIGGMDAQGNPTGPNLYQAPRRLTPTMAAPTTNGASAPKVLDQQTAMQILQQAAGDPALARRIAAQSGFTIPGSTQ